MPSRQPRVSSGSVGSLRPLASPPAAAPPAPPPTPSDSETSASFDDSPIQFNTPQKPIPQTSNSYQKSSSSSSSSNIYSDGSRARSAPIPTITNYGVSPVILLRKEPDYYGTTTNYHSKIRIDGDSSLRPNTGETNDDVGGIGSLREVATGLRWMTIGTTIFAITWEGFALPTRIITETWWDPSKVVLAGYLGVLSLLVLGVELNAPLRDSFGFLYNPIGRGALLYLMSTMCFGLLDAWWESILGISFVICGTGYLYAYAKYPEYRRWEDHNENLRTWSEVRSVISRKVNSWSSPTARYDASEWARAQRETQSLLHNV